MYDGFVFRNKDLIYMQKSVQRAYCTIHIANFENSRIVFKTKAVIPGKVIVYLSIQHMNLELKRRLTYNRQLTIRCTQCEVF